MELLLALGPDVERTSATVVVGYFLDGWPGALAGGGPGKAMPKGLGPGRLGLPFQFPRVKSTYSVRARYW